MKKRHPYVGKPRHQFWKREPGIADASKFDPIIEVPFRIAKDEPVVTAGSCFAQHVAKHLTKSNFLHLVTEKAHPIIDEDIALNNNFGTFSARYGNVYTARQLKQLLLRAYHEFEPIQNSWTASDGTVIDPFRPQIQPGNFISKAELDADRQQHFAAIREAIESMSVFVFTLGLTECWLDPRDGAVFPIAPGVAGGDFDEEIAEFRNFSLSETLDDLFFALDYVRRKNPRVKIILTVSPVPLNATYENRHVWTSTVWSKSVLRLAAEEAVKKYADCTYFPSFEIITSPYARGKYYSDDCRNVTNEGVETVMKLFISHFGSKVRSKKQAAEAPSTEIDVHEHILDMEKRIQVLCDEEAISDK